MKVFDKIDPQVLERREFHLGLLAISLIGIMAIGLATFMYQTVFADPAAADNEIARRVFFGFCALSTLSIAYLVNRQVVIHRLRIKLAEDQTRLNQIRDQASSDLLRTLPGLSHFQDRLAMEFRRCVNMGEPLSLVTFVLETHVEAKDTKGITNTYGDAAKALLLKMRKGDALYLFDSGAFGVVLPGFNSIAAARITERFSKSLLQASEAGPGFSFTARLINYPDEFGSAKELEQAARAALPLRHPVLPSLQEAEPQAEAA